MHLLRTVLCLVLALCTLTSAETCAAACTTTDDCNSGVCCSGVCTAPLLPGAACGPQICGTCADQCNNGVCTQYGPGCVCTTDNDCGPDRNKTFCLSGACAMTGTISGGEVCRDSRQCEDELYCGAGICRGNVTAGGRCETFPLSGEVESDCAQGICQDSVCVDYVPLGGDCDGGNAPCVSGTFCLFDSTNFNYSCVVAEPLGANCSFPAQCLSGVCSISSGICVAPRTTTIGLPCSGLTECVSGLTCACGPMNGTDCVPTCRNETILNLAIGDFCNTFTDLCTSNAICHCLEPTRDCNLAKCIAINSLTDGSNCGSSLECRGQCADEKCFTPASVANGGACFLNQQCVATSSCIEGICTAIANGTTCITDNGCAQNQECQCNGNTGVCQQTTFSTLGFQIQTQYNNRCDELQANITRTFAAIGECYSSYSVGGALSLACQRAMSPVFCCSGCLTSSVLRNNTNLLQEVAGVMGNPGPLYRFDCTAMTMVPRVSTCCRSTNATCAILSDINSYTNCPGAVPISSTITGETSMASITQVGVVLVASILAVLA